MTQNYFFDSLSGTDFELYVKAIFENMGYSVGVTPTSNDYGADLIVFNGQLKIVVQTKRYSEPVGISAIQEIVGAITFYEANLGMVITNNYFTPNAINLATSANIVLWNRDDLITQTVNSFNPSKKLNRLDQNTSSNIDVLPLISNLEEMHHLFVYGAISSGKTNLLHGLIKELLIGNEPDLLKLILVGMEFSAFGGIPYLAIPPIMDSRRAIGAISWAVNEMGTRFAIFAENGAKNIKEYNALKSGSSTEKSSCFPRIVIVIDEMQDVETLANADMDALILKGSKSGIHLIVATQNNKIEKSLCSLFPSAAHLSAGVQYAIELKILHNKPINANLPLVEWSSILELVAELKSTKPHTHSVEEIQRVTMPGTPTKEGKIDEFFHDAVEFLIDKGKGSTSMLQRQFRLGFIRASKLMDDLERCGIVGPEDGVKPRKVTITREEYNELYGR